MSLTTSPSSSYYSSSSSSSSSSSNNTNSSTTFPTPTESYNIINPFKCQLCQHTFNTSAEYYLDWINHEMASETLKMATLKKPVKFENAKKAILRAVTIAQCETIMAAQVRTEPEPDRNFTCAICSKGFIWGNELIQHFLEHLKEKTGVYYVLKIIGKNIKNLEHIYFIAFFMKRPCVDLKKGEEMTCQVCGFHTPLSEMMGLHLLIHPHPEVLRNMEEHSKMLFDSLELSNSPKKAPKPPKAQNSRGKTMLWFTEERTENNTVLLKCNICSAKYHASIQANRHYRNTHSNIRIKQSARDERTKKTTGRRGFFGHHF